MNRGDLMSNQDAIINENKIVIPINKRGTLLYILGSMAFVMAGFLLILFRELIAETMPMNSSASVFIIVLIGAASIIFFGICAVLYCKRLTKTEPILIVDEQGITDNSSALALGFVPWGDVKSIDIAEVNASFGVIEKFININVTDEEKYLSKATKIQRPIIQSNINSGHGVIAINLNSTGIKLEDVFPKMQIISEKNK